MTDERTFPRHSAHELVQWALGLDGTNPERVQKPPADVLGEILDVDQRMQAGWHEAWLRDAWKSGDPIARSAALIEVSVGGYGEEERAWARNELAELAQLDAPASKHAIVSAIGRLGQVLEQKLQPAATRFLVEILQESMMPEAAVWTAVEHVARTEGGRIRPASFHPMIVAFGHRCRGLRAAIAPAVVAAARFDEAWSLCEAAEVPAYLATLRGRLAAGPARPAGVCHAAP